jgi:hypothetical protein
MRMAPVTACSHLAKAGPAGVYDWSFISVASDHPGARDSSPYVGEEKLSQTTTASEEIPDVATARVRVDARGTPDRIAVESPGLRPPSLESTWSPMIGAGLLVSNWSLNFDPPTEVATGYWTPAAPDRTPFILPKL